MTTTTDPGTVHIDDVRKVLDWLGIHQVDDIRTVIIDANAIKVRRLRRGADGAIQLDDDREPLTVRTTIAVKWGDHHHHHRATVRPQLAVGRPQPLEETDDPGDAAWVTRYPDGSGAAVFGTEIEALRHAVDMHMEVVHVPYGEDIFTYREESTR